MNEDQMLMLFQNGDQNGFKAVFDLFYERIYNFSKNLTGTNEDGEEIALTSFHKLWTLKENFKTITNIQAFLYITTRNACLNFIKARNRTKFTGEEPLTNLTQRENNADHSTIKAELLRAIDEEIQKLAPLPRQVIKLRYLDGLSIPEVAEALNISVNAVSVHTHAALKVLRTLPVKRKLQMLLLLILHFMGGYRKYF